MITWEDVCQYAAQGNPEPDRRVEKSEAEWQAERARLMQQNEIASRKVKEMINRLQVLERNSG